MQRLTLAQTSTVTQSAPRRQPTAEPGKSIGDIDVWPAAGGGLLVSLALPALRASPRMRSNLAGFFLKICPWEAHELTIPYVSLSTEGLRWLVDVLCDELHLPDATIRVAERPGGTAAARAMTPGELLKLEWHFRAAVSVAKDLLLAEAAYVWDTNPQNCVLRDGNVVHTIEDLSAAIGTFAAGAALQPLAPATQLRCGRRFGLSAKRGRKTGFSVIKDAWLHPRIWDK
jgi:hypothetical protein